MKFLMTMTSIILMITSIMMTLSFILSKKTFYDREKSSPFECGFDPKSLARMPFSLHFFLITIIFLIFDVEISLIMPMILIFNICSLLTWTLTSMFFMLILMLGIFHEWNQGMLKWTF
uniref:NADH dehydrogenase subunit 3 n=1 Tax=Apsilochorema hwangi TaxID=259356 RepID=UPI0022DCDDE7|nr:NADH dehydrogenase subunit 3 [Apsilochorema hwangi]UZZ43785.1 NADH dehydrogenase subunit 3 [Apsilochorema hwangi]